MNRRTLLLAGAGVLVTRSTLVAQEATPEASVPVYRIALTEDQVPRSQLIIGAVSNVFSPGTSVVYPEGGSGESLVIDYVISGGYQVRSTVDMGLVSADGEQQVVAAGETADVVAGESLVIVENEEEVEMMAAEEQTSTLSLGFFTFVEGTGDVHTDGDLVSTFLGAVPPIPRPDGGVVVMLLEGTSPAEDWEDALAVLAARTESPPADWTFVVLPGTVVGATPAA